MKNIETEVLVIGSGLAGVSAALAAKKSGKKVMVLSQGAAASAMSSGALDICADPIAVPGCPEKWCPDCGKNIDQLLLRVPEHPYRLIADSSEKIIEEIKNAVSLVFPGQDGFITGDAKTIQLAFNQIGTFKQTSFMQTHILSLEDLKMSGGVLVLSFSGLRDFDPGFFAKNFLHWTSRLGVKVNLNRTEIPGSGLSDTASLQMMRWIDENAQKILESIVKAVKANRAELVIMPALLPFGRRSELINRIEKDAQVKFRELLAMPPSAPGRRLSQYLNSRLNQEGIELISGQAAGFNAEAKKILSLLAEQNQDKVEIRGRAFVLATGSFLAGGIEKYDEFKEKLFGLDVFCGNEPLAKIFTEKLTSASIARPHQVFSVGLRADEKMRALTRGGEAAYENLFAAGSILAGGNYIFNGTGAGVALASGMKSGKTLANLA